MQWTWKYADWLIFFLAAFMGIAAFFLPSKDKELAELKRVSAERKAAIAAYQAATAADAARKKEQEELGIVYIPPPPPKPATKPQR